MGRYYLLILGLQTIDKTNLFLQEIMFPDLSKVFWEVTMGVPSNKRSIETQTCVIFGALRNFIGFLSMFYVLWIAVMLKQIIKDPIHRMKRYKVFYHTFTVIISLGLTTLIYSSNEFGVEVRKYTFKQSLLSSEIRFISESIIVE